MSTCTGIPGRPCPRENAKAVVRGLCRTCQYRERRMRETGSALSAREANYLPAAPLLAAVEATGLELAELMDLAWDSTEYAQVHKILYRAKTAEGQVNVYDLDEICCKYLRMHPADIYGDAWWDLSEKVYGTDFTEEPSRVA